MYLTFAQTRNRTALSFNNKRTFFQKVDSLPQGPGWQCEVFESKGDLLDATGKPQIEYLELWKRNPVECVEELISNPLFRDHMKYAAEQIFEDCFGENRMFNEMWTGERWEELQVSTEKSKSSPETRSCNFRYRNSYRKVLHLLLAFLHRTKPSCRHSAGTNQHGLCTSQSETSPRTYAVHRLCEQLS